MKNDVDGIFTELDGITAEVREMFGGLSVEQINRKPDAEGWSIAQCLVHLIKTSEIYSEDFIAIGAGTRQSSFWEKWSPLSGYLGRLLIESLDVDEKKVKTKPRFVPPDDLESDIVERFAASQEELKEIIRSTENADWQKTIVTSSFMAGITYSLADAYKIIITHQRRHLRQAKTLMMMRGFLG